MFRRNLWSWGLIGGLSLLAVSCMQPSGGVTSTSTGFVNFGVGGGVGAQAISPEDDPDNIHAVVVTIEDAEGAVVVNTESLELVRIGNAFTTGSLELTAGDYTLTGFLVVDNADGTLFASPIDGSPAASLVLDPLPIDFTVAAELTDSVVPEVVEVGPDAEPGDFGYTTFGFTIVDDIKAWETATVISTPLNQDIERVKAAIDSIGRVQLVWSENNGTIQNLWATRFVPGSGWDSPTLLESSDPDVGTFDVAIDDDGNALVLWEQATDVLARRYTAGAWQPAEVLATGGPVFTIRVAVDGNGDGLALIQDTASGSLVARRFLAASGWQAPTADEDLSAGGVIDSDDADLAVARFGDAIATWIVDDNVFASRYEVGAGWQAGELIFDGTGFNTQEVGAAISNNGEAFVHWYLTAGTIQSVRSLRYTESGGWDATFAVVANSLGNSPNVTADATMDSFGNVTVVWQNVGNDVFARRYLVGFGWQDSTLLDNLPSSGILGGSQPRIAGDLFGNAAVVWSGGSNIETIRFTPGSGWGTADIIDTEALPARDPVVSMNPEGDVVAAWWQAGDAWSALFR